MRPRIVFFTFIAGFLVLGFVLFNLEVVHGSAYKALSRRNSIRLLPQAGARGRIFDRNGSLIAGNRLSYDVMLMPDETRQREKAMGGIAETLGMTGAQLKEKLRNGYAASFLPVTVSRNVGVKKAMALEELRLDFSGIIIQPNPLREYPHGELACHVIGYLNQIDHWRLTKLADYGYKTRDIVGFGGIEEKYDYYLRQEEGGLLVEVDHRGRFVRVLGFKPPRNGRDVQLTIDLKIQQIAEASLGERKGAVILMDPRSGEVFAMASRPGFHPGIFLADSDAGRRRLVSSRDAVLMNRAISGRYPAGSVFKVVVAAAALETGKINLATSFSCPGFFSLGSGRFACWETHGLQDVFSAIANSCNVFFYHTGLAVGAQAIHDYALRFGLGKQSMVELPYEAAGFVPSPLWKKLARFQNWYDGDTANFSIGQGDLLVTPLQLARVMGVFANKGTLVTPYLTRAIAGSRVPATSHKAASVQLRPSTIEALRQGMRRAVSDSSGTASDLAPLPVAIAGKTGTVQVPSGQPHAWFAGFFPYKEPRFVICVFLEHGGSGHAAVLVAREIIAAMAGEQLL